MIERDLFGGILGILVSTVVARVLLLAYEVHEIVLVVLLFVGAVSGTFVTHYGSRSAETVVVEFQSWNTRLRRVSLRVMLIMLASAALIGVLTVLTANYDTLGRVAGTVITTAIAAGILWPMSVLADRKNTQASGLLGMVAVLVTFFFVIPLIWNLDPSNGQEMLISSLVIGLTVPVGMFFLSLINLPRTWIAARVGMGVFIAVVGLFLVATWHPGNLRSSANWWATGWFCAMYGGLSFACLCGLRKFTIDWRWLGIVAAFIGWVLVLISIWSRSAPSEDLILVFSSISVVLAHTSITALVSLKPNQKWLRIATVACVASTAIFLDAEVIVAPGGGISVLGRIAGALAILGSCGSLALLIFTRLNRAVDTTGAQGDFAAITQITLFCPSCQKRLIAAIGTAECSDCGLRITTAIEPAETGAPKQTT